METSEIDELLLRYAHAEDRIAANLVELDDHPTYGLMTSGVLTGTTVTRVEELMSDAPRLWSGLDALRRTLERARSIRGEGRLNDRERIELEAILTRQSVLVEVQQTPLAERDLLAEGVVEHRVSLDELIDELRSIYEPIRDLVAAIDALWRDVLPRLDAAATSLADLDAEVAALGVVEPTLDRTHGQLADLRRRIMDDPLSVDPDAGRHLDTAVADAAARVGSLRSAHDTLVADLATTEVLVAEARALRARAATSLAEAEAKVLEPAGLVRVPGEAAIDALAAQAAELRHGASGPWQQVRFKLDRWLDLAKRMVDQLGQAAERNAAPLERRNELRGLLSAYRAKAAAVGSIEVPELSELIDEAHGELFTAPVDLARADRLVHQLGRAISGDGTEAS